ncbi:hypothetical protein CMUS01_05868 [Colletotrichum musicola]|uniref:Uncharacterized protein n=1 Tax=Colletotrichum musicola TaxID=2175873 RepID=A0A8H6KPC9_9PEZI|nr:hypothetical protein CMUS01_05868 [Colletotrichum musicola]
MDAVRFTPPSTGEPGLEHDPFLALTQDIPPNSTPSPKKAAPPPLFFVAHGMPWDGMGMGMADRLGPVARSTTHTIPYPFSTAPPGSILIHYLAC